MQLWLLVLILLIGGGMRAAYVLKVSDEEFYHNDGREYMEIARNLAAGKGFALSYYRWHEVKKPGFREGVDVHTDLARTPVLPLLGALLYKTAGDEAGVTYCAKVCSFLLSVFAIYCVFLLGKEFGSFSCGLWSSLIFAFYPYAIYYAGSWSTENVFLIFLALCMTFFLKVLHGKETAFLWCSVFLALAALTRPTAILLAGVLPVLAYLKCVIAHHQSGDTCVLTGISKWKWHLPWNQYRRFWKCLIAFVLLFFLLMMPWTIRNRVAGGSWNMTTYYGGYVFFLSFSRIFEVTYKTLDTAEYTRKTDREWKHVHAHYQKMLQQKKIYHFPDVMTQWKKWGYEEIKAHPERVLYLLKERFFHYWRMCPNLIVLRPYQIVLMRIFFSGLFLLAAGGIAVYWKRVDVWVLLMMVFFGLVISIPFLFVLRYRFPFFAPYVCVLGGGMLSFGWEIMKNDLKKKRRTVP